MACALSSLLSKFCLLLKSAKVQAARCSLLRVAQTNELTNLLLLSRRDTDTEEGVACAHSSLSKRASSEVKTTCDSSCEQIVSFFTGTNKLINLTYFLTFLFSSPFISKEMRLKQITFFVFISF